MDDDKKSRHGHIAEILRSKRIENQHDLMKALEKKGVITTQATLSRDLLEMKVSKLEGFYKILGDSVVGPLWIRVMKDQGISVEEAGEVLVVIKVLPGAAQLVSRAIESEGWPELVGAVAGDDTIFMAVKNASHQKKLIVRLKESLSTPNS